MSIDESELAFKLKPYVLKWIEDMGKSGQSYSIFIPPPAQSTGITPLTLTVSTANAITSAGHTHAITTSNAPVNAQILASDVTGSLTLTKLTVASNTILGGSGAWTTSNWVKQLELDQGETLFWRKGGGSTARGIGTTSNGILYFTRSTADDASQNPTYDMTISETGNVAVGAGVALAAKLHVESPVEQLRLGYNASTYASFTTASNGNHTITTGNNLVLAPTGDVVVDPTGNDVLPAVGYDINIGAIQKKYLTIHAAELWIETLVAQDTISTIGGRINVAPTTQLTRDLAPGDGTIYVKHNQMQASDRVMMMAQGKIEFMSVNSAPTTVTALVEYSYTVTRNLDGTGANQWYAGDAILNTGVIGSGMIDLYSLESVKGAPLEHIYLTSNGSTYSTNKAQDNYWALWPSGVVGETVYYGMEGTKWENIHHFMKVAADLGTALLATEYWNGTTWATVVGLQTSGSLTSGGAYSLTWSQASQTNWAATTINGVSAFWIRWYISSGAVTVAPWQGERRVYRFKSQWGPTIVGWVRNSLTFNDLTEHWAIGNLNGLYDRSTTIYGVAFGKYSTTTPWVSVDATDGLRMMYGNTIKGKWDVSGNITVGEPSTGKSYIYITPTDLGLWNSNTNRISLTSAGVLTIRDGSGNAVLTFDSTTGAEITKKLTMPGVNSAIAIGSTPPTSATAGTGIWIDRTGMYGLNANTLQAKFSATDGKITAGAGSVTLDSLGITMPTASLYTSTSAMKWDDTYGTAGRIYTLAAGGVNQLYLRADGTPSPGLTNGRSALWAVSRDGTKAALVQAESGQASVSQFSVQLDSTNYLTIVQDSGTKVLAKRFMVGDVASQTGDTEGYARIKLYSSHFLPFTAYGQAGNGITINMAVFVATLHKDGYVRDWSQAVYVATTNNSLNYWTIALLNLSTGATISSFSTSSDAADTWLHKVTSGINVSLTATSVKGVYVQVTKTGSPGSLSLGGPAVWYE